MSLYTLPAISRKDLVIPAWLTPRRISQTDMHALLRRVLAAKEREGIAWLRRMWDADARGLSTADIEAMLAQGRVPDAVMARIRTHYEEFVAGKLAELTRGAATEMGAGFARGASLAFDPKAPGLLEVLASRTSRLPVELATQQRAALDLVIRYAAETAALPAGTIAETLRHFIGLTSRDAAAVLKVREAMAEAGATPKAIARQVANYSAHLRQARALRIARTELAYAANEGKIAAIEQAIANGELTGEVVREWNAAEDEATCPICSELDGLRAPLRGEFDGGYDGPPAHPSCRCVTDEYELEQKG